MQNPFILGVKKLFNSLFSNAFMPKLYLGLGFMLFLTLSVVISSCNKDITKDLQPTAAKVPNPISVEEARSAFESKYGKVHTIKANNGGASANSSANGGDDLVIAPLWTQARVAAYMQTNPLLLVPIQNVPALDTVQSGYSLVFYRDSTGVVKQKLQVYMPDKNYAATHRKFTTQDFTGVFYQIAMSGASGNALKIENGRFTARMIPQTATLRDDPGDCPTWGTGWWQRFTGWLAHVFGGLGGGSGDYTPAEAVVIPGMMDFVNYINTYGPTGGGGGSSGGGGSNNYGLPDEMGNEIFDMDDDRIRLFFIHNRLRLDYAETQLLRFNTCLAIQLEQFLVSNTVSAANTALARIQLGLLVSNPAYAQANLQAGCSINILTTLAKYLNADFTPMEFAELFADQQLFQQVDAFLTRQSNSPESFRVAKIHIFLSQKESYKNTLLDTNYDNRVIDALLTAYRNNELSTILYSDCHSWSYQPVLGGVYQVCGMSGLYFDVLWTKFNANTGKLELEYFVEVLQSYYFEYPRIRASGAITSAAEAAESSADAVDSAERATEKYFADRSTKPSLFQVESKYVEFLTTYMENRGGRFTKNDNYGVGINSLYTTSFIKKYCQ